MSKRDVRSLNTRALQYTGLGWAICLFLDSKSHAPKLSFSSGCLRDCVPRVSLPGKGTPVQVAAGFIGLRRKPAWFSRN